MRLDELLSIVPLWLVRSSVFVFGLLWGSFLNVVIYRVPREMSVVRPASHCPGCGKPVEAYDNVPVLSYVILRGRARCCGARMSPRYPLVELIGGALSLAILEVIVLNLPGSTSIGHAAAIYVADFALCLGLVAAAFIDAEHMFLPDSITIGGAIVGVFTASLRGLGTMSSIAGAAAGFFGIFIPFIFLYKGLLGRTGMGLGDAKLLALAGAWFGWPGALFTLLAGAVQGSVYAGVTRLLGIEPTLPAAVLEDIAELEKAAAAGDEEAKKALAEDPLTEDGNDAFIVRFFGRLFGAAEESHDAGGRRDATSERDGATTEGEGATTEGEDASATTEGEDASDAAPRARIPFGPFLILAILELLFAGEWLKEKLLPFLWPVL
ncbi:MAG: prepilin peptidase [Labilithrix sp.]|nr:prepilin peptidase [Labilithrix sp.]